jgi:hypothetical protein
MSDDDADHGFTICRGMSRTGRSYVRVTASDGRAVSFYDDGDVCLIKAGLILNLSPADPDSAYVELVSPPR